jgi:CheY-like chemotaxis protein
MILIVASSRASGTRIRSALPAGVVTRCVTGWQEACEAAPHSGCIVLELTLAQGTTFADRVHALRRLAPGIAVVAVAPLHPGAVRSALSAGVDDFVACEALAEEGWSVIREARARTLREQVVSLVRSAGGLGDTLREAMIRAIDADTVPRTAAALALLSRSSRTTLYRSAKNGASSGHGGRVMREVLDWIALVHCASRKRRDLSWEAVAHEANIDLRTLRTIARRRTGAVLTELEEPGHATLLAACRAWTAVVSGSDHASAPPLPFDAPYAS